MPQKAGSSPKLRTTMSSRMPRPTYRWRKTTRWESARPRGGWSRSTNDAENGSVVVAASGSGTCPLTRSSISDRNRVSR